MPMHVGPGEEQVVTHPPAAMSRTHAAAAAGGMGLGAAVAAALSGHPEIITKAFAALGPALPFLSIIFGLGFVMDKHLPSLVKAQMRTAESMGELSTVVKEHFGNNENVSRALRTMAGEIRDLVKEVQALKG